MCKAEVEIRAAEHRMRNGYFTPFDAVDASCRKRPQAHLLPRGPFDIA